MQIDGSKHKKHLEAAYDVVIIGSGAAGATAARVLVDSGLSVCIVEEGAQPPKTDFSDKAWPMFAQYFRDASAQVAQGRAIIPVLQGCAVGGSTVMNSAIMWRMPEDVWSPWEKEYGLGWAMPYDSLVRHWETLESELHIHPTEQSVWGKNNEVMHRGAKKKNYQAAPTNRAALNCKGSASCLTGCVHGAKQSMHITYLPYATSRGCTLIYQARVEKIVITSGNARSIEGTLRKGPGQGKHGTFRIHASKAIVVAASAIQTPNLLRRSGLRSPHLGAHFQGHPGAPLVALFDEVINPWNGATQGYDMDHARREYRVKIETISLPPEVMFVRLPGLGKSWLENIAKTNHMAVCGVQLRAFAQGRVRPSFSHKAAISYDLEPRDMANLKHGLRLAAETYFAAGAKAILPAIHGLPEVITNPDDLKLIDEGPDDPRAYSFILSHLMGTARMSPTSDGGVVNTTFAVHDIPNLFVVDSSIFPTNLGVNPQQTIMGIAMHAAQRIADVLT